jgi:flagellar hook-length control protein FliK
METNLANIPDANAVQQCNAASVTSHEGNPQSGKSGKFSFAAIVNKEIHNSEVNNESENSGINSSSDIRAAKGLKNESGQSEKDSGQNVQGKKGLKTDNILLYILGSSIKADTNGLPDNLVNKIDDSKMTEETLQQLVNQQDQTTPAEKGLLTALINLLKDQKTTEEALRQSKDQQGQNMSAEKGLLAALIDQNKDQKTTEEAHQQSKDQQEQNMPAEKGLAMGALLYAISSNVVNPGGDPHNQGNSDTKSKGRTFTGEIKGDRKHGLKAGMLLGGAKSENKNNPALSLFIKEGTGEDSAEKALPAPAHNENSKIASDSNKLSGVEKLLEHVDKNNKSELNNLKSARVQQALSDPGLAKNNNNSKNIQSGPPPEIAKEINKAEGLKNYPDNSVKTVKVEATSDNSNLLNHSGIKLEGGRLAEVISTGNAPKLSGPNQVIDNIVYVIKSSSKMGVSLEHDILGKLNIDLSMEKGMLNVHINTSEKMAREFIQDNIQYIVNSLAKDGVSVGGFSVGLKNHNDQEGNAFVTNNKQDIQDNQVFNEKARVSAINGLVSVFA